MVLYNLFVSPTRTLDMEMGDFVGTIDVRKSGWAYIVDEGNLMSEFLEGAEHQTIDILSRRFGCYAYMKVEGPEDEPSTPDEKDEDPGPWFPARPPSDPEAAWHPDPLRLFEQRHWDGVRWTEHVFSDGVQSIDQRRRPAPPPRRTGSKPPRQSRRSVRGPRSDGKRGLIE